MNNFHFSLLINEIKWQSACSPNMLFAALWQFIITIQIHFIIVITVLLTSAQATKYPNDREEVKHLYKLKIFYHRNFDGGVQYAVIHLYISRFVSEVVCSAFQNLFVGLSSTNHSNFSRHCNQ